MIVTDTLYSLADISIIPCSTTKITSRSNCIINVPSIHDGFKIKLPVIVSPMSCNFQDASSEEECAKIYDDAGVNVVIPRTVDFTKRLELCKEWMTAFSLSESKSIPTYIKPEELSEEQHINICIDMANGHMEDQINTGKELKKLYGKQIKLMGGNIANPGTYRYYSDAEFDYIRVGIGGGNACLTSTQSGVHYPMASLLDEIRNEKHKILFSEHGYETKIVADGGISCYSDITKCLALGADYVMLGKIFTKAALNPGDIGKEVEYYGMSTKKAQAEMGNTKLKTSEGRCLKVKKEYSLSGWVENFSDYLRTAMSYTDCRDLYKFRSGKVECRVISPNSSYAINNK